MGFSRQEYWSRLLFSSGDLPELGINLDLLHCRQILYHLSHQGSLNIFFQISVASYGLFLKPFVLHCSIALWIFDR